MKLVECVPNFSEGRDKAKIGQLVAAAGSVPGVRVLDVEADPDHHRCVLSYVGPPEAALEAAFRSAAKALEVIDLNSHKGEHPRMGAVDVIPFIPVAGTDMRECVALARRLAERIGAELSIPVYLYGQAAAREDRRDLAAVRKGQFEGLRLAIEQDPRRAPDFGPTRMHPTAGAVAVGAREQIINFNVNLDLADVEEGKTIAKKIRASGGGLPALRAKEILLSSGLIQISTVLTDYRTTGIHRALDAILIEARARGADLLSTEIVGLVPRTALLDYGIEALKLSAFDPKVQILEDRLDAVAGDCPESLSENPTRAETSVAEPSRGARSAAHLKGAQATSNEGAGQRRSSQAGSDSRMGSKGLSEPSGLGWRDGGAKVAEALASTDPTPGGGSAACIAGAMGCGLGEMAVGISLGSKRLEAEKRPRLETLKAQFASARADLQLLAGADAAAFERVMAALKLPKDDLGRAARVQAALQEAAEVPLETARVSAGAFDKAREAGPACSPNVASDANCAAHLLASAVRCAIENVRINTGSLKDKETASRLEREAEALLERVRS